jgi:asparagine synthase (glutamine-hydrolysing)
MCGIFGYWDRARRPLGDEVLQEMARKLFHRGPDDQGIQHWPDRGAAVGARRLSIIDIEGGHQPFVSGDGLISVVQNGEIYNYIELADALRREGVTLDTASDTEVILRLYEREGIDFVKRLNGMFAIAIDDARDDVMYLVRDRIGVKPLYFADNGKRMLFGSEIKALLAPAEIVPELRSIDIEAIHHYLSFNYIPAPWTIWKNVRHVMPGTWMKFNRRSGVETVSWWTLSSQQEKDHRFDDWSAEFLSILDDSTRLRLRADVPWGAFLSGGVDSSTIVALMTRHVERPVKTFCIGFEDPLYDESAFAREAARRFGCEHTSEIADLNMLDRWPEVLYHLDQPHGDASFMPTLRVCELAAKHVKVVLTGDGGDELFAGYDKYPAFFSRPDAHTLAPGLFQQSYFDSISLFSPAAKKAMYQPLVAKRLEQVDTFSAAASPWFEQSQHFDRVNQALYLDMQLLLSGNNLVKPDRMGMAVSIEARTPFLDYRMMEFAFRSRGNTKLRADDKKHWYKRAAAPLMGGDLAYRKKQMFTMPIGEWFRGESYGWLASTLGGSNLLQRLFRPEAIESMLLRHVNGSANFTRELRALAALALWAEQALK